MGALSGRRSVPCHQQRLKDLIDSIIDYSIGTPGYGPTSLGSVGESHSSQLLSSPPPRRRSRLGATFSGRVRSSGLVRRVFGRGLGDRRCLESSGPVAFWRDFWSRFSLMFFLLDLMSKPSAFVGFLCAFARPEPFLVICPSLWATWRHVPRKRQSDLIEIIRSA